jgi:gliding motility-associated-like protein
MKPIKNFLVAGLLLLCAQVFGQMQVAFNPSSLPSVPVGSDVSIQVKVTGFTNISSLQLPITYDKTVLHFDSLDNPILPGYGDSTLASFPTAGKIVISWYPQVSQYPNGVTEPAGTVIFTLRFTVLKAGQTTVVLSTMSPGIEVINSIGNALTVTYTGTSVTTITNGGGGGGGTQNCTGTGNPPSPTPYSGFKMIANRGYAVAGEHTCIPITVNAFTTITSLQYAIHWDSTLFQFDCTRGFNLDGLTPGNFNNTTSGTQVVSWFDPSANFSGVTRPDGAKIYEICFKGIGAPGTGGPITINCLGFPQGAGGCEATNTTTSVWTANTPVSDSLFVVNPSSPGCPIQFSAAKDTVDLNGNICVDVKASKFYWGYSSEFQLTYDPTKLTYQNIQLGTNPLNLTTTGTANFTQASGIVKFTWANAAAANGTTIPDNSTIFSVCFKSTGGTGSTAPINITSNIQCPVAAIDAAMIASRKNIGGVPFVGTNGFVHVKDGPTCSVTAAATSPACPGGAANLTATTGGTGCTASAYAWAGPNAFTSTAQNPTNATIAGVYTVTVTFGASGTVSATTTLTVPMPTATVTATNPACAGGNGSLSAAFSGGCTPASYLWAGPGGYQFTGPNPTNVTTSGVYTLTATFTGGATVTATGTITGPSPSVTATATNPACGNINGQVKATIGGSGCTASSYAWSGPGSFSSTQNPANATVSGTYTVTVTFPGNATATASTTLTVPPAIVLGPSDITVLGVSCYGLNDGSITINPSGGTPALTYAWSGPGGFTSTNQNIGNRIAGNYTVTITDSKGCTLASSTLNIPTPTAIAINTAQITIVNPKCNNGSDGSISLTGSISGGTSPYSANWSGPGGFTASGLTISNLAAGAYSVTVSDNKGCTIVSQTMNLFQPTPLNVTLANITNVKCFNDANGSIEINISGGTPAPGASPYTQVWKNVTNTIVNPTALAAGTYSVTVSDANNCTKTLLNKTVQGPTSALNVQMVSSSPAICPGDNTGTMCIGINGGWAGTPTISWTSNLPPLACQNGISSGTYTATVTDAGSCTATVVVTVQGPPAFSTAPAAVNDVTCFGSGDGSINIGPISGGNGGPYMVTWTNTTLTSPSISNLPGGTYTPTVKDGSGCTKVFATITVNEPLALTLTPGITHKTSTANNGAITLTVTGGTPAYNYLWNGPGVVNVTTKDLANLNSGDYTVVVTDSRGCSKTQTFNVPQDLVNHLPGSTITSIKQACDNDGCIYISINPQAPAPYVLSWTGGGTLTVSNPTVSICGLAGSINQYSVTITDNDGFSIVLDTLVPQGNPASINQTVVTPSYASQHTGSIQIFPDFPSTYLWDYQGKTTSVLSGLDCGTYHVTVTNQASGCTHTYSFVVPCIYPPLVTEIGSQVNPPCSSANTGEIHLNLSGGHTPYSVLWSGPGGFTSTSTDIIGLAPGAYTAIIHDQDSTRVLHATLTAQSSLAISSVNVLSNYNGYQVSGASSCDGSANVLFAGQSGATSISWSNGVQNVSQDNTLCAGPYSVTITDNVGCTASYSGNLSAPAAITIEPAVDSLISCHAKCNGVAHVTVGGGVAPYTVHWSNGRIDQLLFAGEYSQAVNLCGGSYKVTVTDHNGITKVQDVVVNEPAPLGLTLTGTAPSNFNNCDGKVLAEVPGAALPVTFNWVGNKGTSHHGKTQEADNLCSGEIVQYVVVDANGCTEIASDSVPYPVDGCLLVRPILTPGQQDGKNDFTFITCIETVQNTVEIYNRWGQLVFQTTNYDNASNNWKGLTRTGEPLAEGVYYYILTYTDPTGNQQQKKGYINIIL